MATEQHLAEHGAYAFCQVQSWNAKQMVNEQHVTDAVKIIFVDDGDE